jgi:hypothetical protein
LKGIRFITLKIKWPGNDGTLGELGAVSGTEFAVSAPDIRLKNGPEFLYLNFVRSRSADR